ncbi:MAG: aminotransferase class V-fold PLP-dependent enzyme [Betaproteobacteria bacterium]
MALPKGEETMTAQPLIFKIATEPREFALIHDLNYRTFVEEIPQHPANRRRALVDAHHRENTYIICLAGDTLAGMVALRGRRPFSLDRKLADLDAHLPPGRRPCEIRLLAVEPAWRKTSVFLGLVLRLAEVARVRGYDLALISGTTRQLRLYGHLGFRPFGPLVGAAGAQYQPMQLTLEGFEERMGELLADHGPAQPAVSFLPGPVQVGAAAERAFRDAALSHRDERFGEMLGRVKSRLRELTLARHVSILLGSGTLANDAVAAQLAQRPGKGLVLANGEFGERLIDHARRWRLGFEAARVPWGEPLPLERIAAQRPRWLWIAHCETSTGMLNDLPAIVERCRASGSELCVDAISSLGTVPVDLAAVAFATAVSGKGIGAHAGLAIVLHREPARAGGVPRYLDLGLYGAEREVPFTLPSNLLASLQAALGDIGAARFERIRRAGALLRRRLGEAGFACLSAERHASPAVLTIALPRELPAAELAAGIAKFGYAVAWASAYLRSRNWVQVALMGEFCDHHVTDLAALFAEAAAARSPRRLAA